MQLKKISMKWLSKISLLVLLLSSCSAQYHLKRAIKKDPTILEKDTVTVVDTVVSAPVEVRDTVTLQERDTLVITKERLKLKIVRSFDTIAVEAECESDTIISTIRVPYEKVVYVQERTLKEKLQIWGFYLMIGLFVYLAVRRLANG
jgi:hypothetical protein